MLSDIRFLKKYHELIMCLLISLMVWSTPELRAEEPVGKVEALTCVVQVERNGQKQSVKIGEPVILTPNMISHVTGDNPPLPPPP